MGFVLRNPPPGKNTDPKLTSRQKCGSGSDPKESKNSDPTQENTDPDTQKNEDLYPSL